MGEAPFSRIPLPHCRISALRASIGLSYTNGKIGKASASVARRRNKHKLEVEAYRIHGISPSRVVLAQREEVVSQRLELHALVVTP